MYRIVVTRFFCQFNQSETFLTPLNNPAFLLHAHHTNTMLQVEKWFNPSRISFMPTLRKSIFRSQNYGYLFFLMFFVFKLPNNATGLADAYQFRQTQTAWGIREALRHGYSFFDLRMPVLGYPYKVPFEFPLFQNMAAFVGNLLNTNEIESGRLTSLFLFCVGGLLTFKIVERLTSTLIAIFCITLIYLTPFAIQWSNAVLIESLASFFLILSSFILRIYFETSSKLLLIAFTVITALGALVKITTIFPLMIFLSVLLSWRTNFKYQPKSVATLVISLSASIVPALLWTNFADSIKEKSDLTSWLTSQNLRTWNFGTFSQRFVETDWVNLLARYWLFGGVAVLVLLPCLFVYLIGKKRTWFIFLLLLLPLVSPLTYFNLYVVHDYYFMAVVFPTILSFAFLLKFAQQRIQFSISAASLLCLILIFLIPSWTLTIPLRDYKTFIASDRNVVPLLANEIKRYTLPKDRILLVGCDWDPSILFYADRYGVAAPGWIGSTDQALVYLDEHPLVDSPKYLAICGNSLPSSTIERGGLSQISTNIWKLEN
jgi:4-amino-4-deoxy-L-arabinose transferase-like glycosyltransferase